MSERVAALDLLRGVAAASVAIPHFLLYRSSGHPAIEGISVIAVEVFFVLSGYVLAPQILLVLERRSLRDLGTFLARRWMRTVPAYAVALLLVSALVGAVGSAEFWRYLLYVQNVTGQHNADDYYSIAWSLSVEEWFYVTFPLFLLAVSLAGGQRYALAALAFILAVTALRSAFGDPHDWGAAVRRVVVFRVDSIAYGFLLFLALRRRAICRPLPLAAGLLLSVALILSLLQVVDHSRAAQAAYPLAAALFGSLTIALALALEPIAQRLSAIAAVAGTTSYAVYLYHLLAIYLLARVDWPLWAGLCAFCCLTALLAAASSYGLEKPILAMRPSYDRAAAAADARV